MSATQRADPKYLVKRTELRQRPKRGDVFALTVGPVGTIHGLVVRTDAWVGPFLGHLIYLFRPAAGHPPRESPLRPEQLLVPPMIVSQLLWSRGYAERVDRRIDGEFPELERHCFASARASGPPWFFDEFSNRLEGPCEVPGEHALFHPGGVDREISLALGLPVDG